ncbi:VOC family protein [Mycobacterium innocens]|uniref:VOC family protein n=1 Tax=Mycobacterium innocens TaxID=2341083 RepID=UPI001FC9CE73|nr:VOC family protein [Mycobacterium innocens]
MGHKILSGVAGGARAAGRRQVENVITGLAHTGICVPDCVAAVTFYREVLGLQVLSPPLVMGGNAIRDDMGELVSDPTMKAAIVVGHGPGRAVPRSSPHFPVVAGVAGRGIRRQYERHIASLPRAESPSVTPRRRSARKFAVAFHSWRGAAGIDHRRVPCTRHGRVLRMTLALSTGEC